MPHPAPSPTATRWALRAAVLALALPLCALPAGCGGGGITSQNRPRVVSTFPADGAILPGWLHAVRVTYDDRVRVLNDKAVAVEANGVFLDATVVPHPTDDHSVLVLTEGGRWIPGVTHVVEIREGAVVNDDNHYMDDERRIRFVVGPRPHVFVATAGGLFELDVANGAQVASTTVPAGYAPTALLGAAEEVFVWLDKTGGGDDELACFAPGDAAATVVPLSGESGERRALGLALSSDGRLLYATTVDLGAGRMRVHRVDVATRAEVLPSLELATDVSGSAFVAKRPAVDPVRGRLYVAQDDGAGGGTLSVVDLSTFTEVDVRPGAGTAAVLVDGAGDLAYGIRTERIWMTIADEPYAGLVVLDPWNFSSFEAREQEFTGPPVASLLTPDERFFVQGLAGYAGRDGIVRSTTAEIGQGFVRTVNDDVGGVLAGSDTVGALVVDPGRTTILAFATGSGSTVLLAYEWEDLNVTQLDLDPGTDGVQGLDLSASAPGHVVAATFLAGARAP